MYLSAIWNGGHTLKNCAWTVGTNYSVANVWKYALITLGNRRQLYFWGGFVPYVPQIY